MFYTDSEMKARLQHISMILIAAGIGGYFLITLFVGNDFKIAVIIASIVAVIEGILYAQAVSSGFKV